MVDTGDIIFNRICADFPLGQARCRRAAFCRAFRIPKGAAGRCLTEASPRKPGPNRKNEKT